MESVVLIDAYRPEVLPDSRRIRLQTQLNLGLFWLRKNYYYYGNREDLQRIPAKLWEKVRGRFGSADTAQPVEARSLQAPSYEARYAQAIAANDWAAARYQAIEYDGTLKLFRAKIQMLEWYFGKSLGWQTVNKERLSSNFIPGFFGNLFNQRAAPILAEQVKAYLSTLPSAQTTPTSSAPTNTVTSEPASVRQP